MRRPRHTRSTTHRSVAQPAREGGKGEGTTNLLLQPVPPCPGIRCHVVDLAGGEEGRLTRRASDWRRRRTAIHS